MPEARALMPAPGGGLAPGGARPRQCRALAPRDISIKTKWQWGRIGMLAAVLLGLGAPAQAEDCTRLGSEFAFCPAGSDWAGAEWEAGGDLTDVILGDVFFWFSGAWGGRAAPVAGAPLPSLARELDALLDWSAEAPPGESRLLTRDSFAAGEMRAERAIQRIVLPDAPPAPLLRATMIVAAPGGARLMLALQGAETVGEVEIDRRSREIVALLRPRQEK